MYVFSLLYQANCHRTICVWTPRMSIYKVASFLIIKLAINKYVWLKMRHKKKNRHNAWKICDLLSFVAFRLLCSSASFFIRPPMRTLSCLDLSHVVVNCIIGLTLLNKKKMAWDDKQPNEQKRNWPELEEIFGVQQDIQAPLNLIMLCLCHVLCIPVCDMEIHSCDQCIHVSLILCVQCTVNI